VDFKREKKFYMKITEMLEQQYRPSTAWCFSKGGSMIDEYVVHFAEYAGIGSGSIGYLQGTVYANTFDIGDYIAQVNKSTFPFVGKKNTTLRERLRYEFLMRLFGLQLDLSQLAAKFLVNPYTWLWPEIFFFRMAGGLKKQGQMLALTRKGRYYWVIMMREFFIGVNNFRDYCRAAINSKS
jgi:coproporphyrinogen III oxidase-like Fe-S oxidoreductase